MLGGVEAVGALGRARLGNRLERLLAVLLAHRNAEVDRDTLISTVWDGSPEPAAAEETLRLYVSRLRAALRAVEPGDADIRTTPRGYRLDVEPERVDVDAALQDLARAQRAGAPDVVRSVLDRVDARPYGAMSDEWWCHREVERLAQARRAALDALGAAPAAGGRTGIGPPAPTTPPALGAPPYLPFSVVAQRDLPFVGRADELAALGLAWAQLRRRGGQATASVSGPAGIGKSRLVAEFTAQAATEGACVLHGGFDAELRTPYAPFAQAIRRHLVEGGPGAATLLGSLRPRDRFLLGFDELPDGAHVPRAPHDDVARFADQLAAAVSALSRAGPVVLVVEDLQWAESASATVLAQLATVASRPNTLLVMTHRTEPLDATDAAQVLLRRLDLAPALTRLELGGLATTEAEALAAAIVGRDRARALAARLFPVTGGHPLLLRGSLEHTSADSAAPEAARQVRAFVEGRLGLLSPAARATVELASALGASLDLDVLVAASAGPAEALLHVDEAIGCRVLRATGRDGRDLAFVHQLVRDAVYDALPESRRRSLHARLDAALVAARPTEPWLAVGHAVRSRLEGASLVSRCQDAGRALVARLAFEAAAEIFGEGVLAHRRAALDDTTTLCELLVEHGEALAQLRAPEAVDVLLEAWELADRLDLSPLLARALIAMLPAKGMLSTDREERASSVVVSVVRRLIEADEPDAALSLAAEVADRVALVDIGDEGKHLARALLADAGLTPRRRVATTLRYTQLLVGADDLAERMRTSALGVRLAEDDGDAVLRCRAGILDAHSLLFAGRAGAAGERARQVVRLASDAHLPSLAHEAGLIELGVDLLCGGPRALGPEAGVGASENIPDHPLAGLSFTVRSALATVRAFEAGTFAEASGPVRALLAVLEAREPTPTVDRLRSVWEMVLAHNHAWFGDAGPVRRLLDRAEERADVHGVRDHVWLVGLNILAFPSWRVGHRRLGAFVYEHAAGYVEWNTWNMAVSLGPVERGAGLAAAGAGRFAVAVRHLEGAWERCRAWGLPTWEARTAVELAAVLCQRAGRLTGPAQDLARRARASATELGSTYTARCAERVLATGSL